MFEKGNKIAKGRPRGSKNRLTNDVRQVFHKVYDEMGSDTEIQDEVTGQIRRMTGHEAMLLWAKTNQTEFYRLYGKMIPATAELPEDMHEDFVQQLIFEDEEAELTEVKAVDVGNDPQKLLPSGAAGEHVTPPEPMSPREKADSS